MILGKTSYVDKGSIRGTDVPTEYIVIFAFAFIGTIGALIGCQIRKARSSLPTMGSKRLD